MTAKFVGHHSSRSQASNDHEICHLGSSYAETLVKNLKLGEFLNIASRAAERTPLPGAREPGAGVGACVAAKQLRLKLRPDSH